MWINVQKNLPRFHENVLVKLQNGTITGAFYEHGVFDPVGVEPKWSCSDEEEVVFSSRVVEWTSLCNIGEES